MITDQIQIFKSFLMSKIFSVTFCFYSKNYITHHCVMDLVHTLKYYEYFVFILNEFDYYWGTKHYACIWIIFTADIMKLRD